MISDQDGRRVASPGAPTGDVRRLVVEAVHDVKAPTMSASHADLDLYLALLQDRLPVYAARMADLLTPDGQTDVEATLVLAARATLDFYGGILAAKISVLARPTQLARLRQAMQPRRLGPEQAEIRVAEYLHEEQKIGRVAPQVDPLATARLLIGTCLYHAFTAQLLGEEHVPSREEYAVEIVRGLRLTS